MKKLILLLVLLGVLTSTGCTLTETAAERRRRTYQITNLQMRMMVEDWDYIWLYDHNTQMTQWHPWVGI